MSSVLIALAPMMLLHACGAPSPRSATPETERAAAAEATPQERAAASEALGRPEDEADGEASVSREATSAEATPWELDRPSPIGARTCPTATDVHRAQWARPGERRSGPGTWAVPVGCGRVDDEDYDGVPDQAVSPEGLRVGTIARARVEGLGFIVLPRRVWLMRAGQPPCAATVAGYQGEVVAHGVTNIAVRAVLRGCSSEADAAAPQAWVSTAEPVGCALVEPTLLSSARVIQDGESATLALDPAALPAGFERPVMDAECGEACTTLHAVHVARGVPDVAEVWVSRTDGLPAGEPCQWMCESGVALEVRGRDGTMRVLPYPVVDEFARTMTLAGILLDASGTRVVLLTDHAASGARELLDDGTFGAGTLLEEFIPSEEDGVYRSLCPNCGP